MKNLKIKEISSSGQKQGENTKSGSFLGNQGDLAAMSIHSIIIKEFFFSNFRNFPDYFLNIFCHFPLLEK